MDESQRQPADPFCFVVPIDMTLWRSGEGKASHTAVYLTKETRCLKLVQPMAFLSVDGRFRRRSIPTITLV